MDKAATSSHIAPGRSCAACRKRKIRCDRSQPCSYCTKLRVECVYPSTSERTGSLTDTDVATRLRRIELSLARLESTLITTDSSQQTHVQQESINVDGTKDRPPASGKLIQNGEDATYTTGSFWTELDEDADEDATEHICPTNPPTSMPTTAAGEFPQQRQGLMLGFSPVSNLHKLHPPETRIFALWQVFLESVDPLLKIVHIPVTQRQLLRAVQNLENILPGFEALMFAMYYAAITSIQCTVSFQTLFKEDRQILLDRYSVGVEQALKKARFLTNPDILSLQALTLYLICARQNADKGYVWAMTGLLMRLATKLGLHRDPGSLGLSPFASEMRRRLWSQICILDVRTAEENDMDPMLCEHNFDTRFPANVNDSDLDVNMTRAPFEAQSRTEMMYTLARIKISYEARKIVFSPQFEADNGYQILSPEDKSKMLENLQKEIEARFLQGCDSQVPICYLTATSARIVLLKMKLTVHHPARKGSLALSRELLEELTGNAIKIVEYTHALRTSEKYAKWVWLFQKYTEWDAVASLLHILIAAPVPSLVDKAWSAIDLFFKVWQGHVPPGDRRWQRLVKLRSRAHAKRASHSVSGVDQNTVVDVGEAALFTPVANAPDTYPNSAMMHPVNEAEVPGAPNNAPQDFAFEADVNGDSWWNAPYTAQGLPSWEMDIDESVFHYGPDLDAL